MSIIDKLVGNPQKNSAQVFEHNGLSLIYSEHVTSYACMYDGIFLWLTITILDIKWGAL